MSLFRFTFGSPGNRTTTLKYDGGKINMYRDDWEGTKQTTVAIIKFDIADINRLLMAIDMVTSGVLSDFIPSESNIELTNGYAIQFVAVPSRPMNLAIQQALVVNQGEGATLTDYKTLFTLHSSYLPGMGECLRQLLEVMHGRKG